MTSDKLYYSGTENLEARIDIYQHRKTNPENIFCYLQLLNSRQILIKEVILKLRNEKSTYHFSLSGVDSGIYCLRLVDNNLRPVTVVWIGVNVPEKLQNQNISPTLTLYAEGGQALSGFTQTFLGTLLSPQGTPLQKTIFIRNKEYQLIAAGKTNLKGMVALKIPLVKDDVLTISTAGGESLAVYQTNDTAFCKETGFAIQASHADGQLLAEAWRGIAELKNNLNLHLYSNDTLLFETHCIFREDTNIIVTSFPLQNLTNRLLKLVLTDANNNTYASRYFFVPDNAAQTSLAFLPDDLPCMDNQTCLLDINDRLIAFTNFHKRISKQGFSLFFQNKNVPNTLLNYAIIDEKNVLLQAGLSEVNNNGIIELSECVFENRAYVQFYSQGKTVNGFQNIGNPNLPIFPKEIIASEIKKLILTGNDSADKMINRNFIELVKNNDETTMEEVTVSSTKKSRVEELDEIYVSNGMFRDMFSIKVDVESDNFAINYKAPIYAQKVIPGLTAGLNYRGGYIDIYLDEVLIDKPVFDNIFMGDIAYMKFFKNPVRGGMAAQKGGALLKGDGYAAGLQGSLALYTKKHVEKGSTNTGNKGIPVYGYVN